MLKRAIMILMDKANKQTTPLPKPFLAPLFKPGVEPKIATGYRYHKGEVALHGVESHGAIDFDLPRDTPILAPADGYYIATYGERLMYMPDGSPRTLGLEQALQSNLLNTDLNPPPGESPWRVWFGSYVVQGWHERGRYTQYAHVDWVNPTIPYYPPVELKNEAGQLTGDLQYSPMLRATVDQYRIAGKAKFLRAGEVIAETGMTGCGWGKRCYDYAKLNPKSQPDFRGVDYPYYTSPHLHFMVFGRRAPKTRNPKLFDPFGIYGHWDEGYPSSRNQWHQQQPAAKHNSLWLPQQ